ncbi:MAG: glycosyltransferase family 4 protein [Candidatus Symbiothrix sp.]|jgi:glycosyltransferase involved in cell wall biosynthesis|nr:glycosyltransferase family 4 protein [Candidatus Symbiothrix sp.]
MKITHVLWSFTYGGAETMLIDIANRQCADNEVEILIINDNIAPDLLAQLNKKIKIRLIRRPLKSKNPYYLLKLNVFIAFSDANILHFHQDNIIRYLPMRVLKKNLCLTVHDVKQDVTDLRKYNYLFSISDAVRDSIRQQSGIISPVINNGVDIALFRRQQHKKNKIFSIVQIGRLRHIHKGQHLSLQAIYLIVNRYHCKNIHLDMIGAGESEPYLKQLAEQLNISEYVSFLGARSKDYIREHLTDYDLLVQPSLWEGFGLTIVEAMSAMTPVLCSNIDGMTSIAKNGEMAAVFTSENVNDYAAKIYEIMMQPPEQREKWAEKACHYVTENFDISQTVKNYQNIYKQITNKTYEHTPS